MPNKFFSMPNYHPSAPIEQVNESWASCSTLAPPDNPENPDNQTTPANPENPANPEKPDPPATPENPDPPENPATPGPRLRYHSPSIFLSCAISC